MTKISPTELQSSAKMQLIRPFQQPAKVIGKKNIGKC